MTCTLLSKEAGKSGKNGGLKWWGEFQTRNVGGASISTRELTFIDGDDEEDKSSCRNVGCSDIPSSSSDVPSSTTSHHS